MGLLMATPQGPASAAASQRLVCRSFAAMVKRARVVSPIPDMAGKVVDQIEKGYLLGSKIIRYAKVVVADQHPA